MPSFEWLKIKEGKTSGIPQKFQEFPNPFCLVSKKRMHDICMLLDARMILEWAFSPGAKGIWWTPPAIIE